MKSIRPVLPKDTVFGTTDEGMFFRRKNKNVKIKGVGIYSTFSKIVTLLDGEHSLEDISQSFANPRPFLDLLNSLLKKEILITRTEDWVKTLGPDLNSYKTQLNFLEHFVEHPAQAFNNYQLAKVLMLGEGVPLVCAANTLLLNGLKKIYFHTDIPTAKMLSTIQNAPCLAPIDTLPCWNQEMFDLVVYVSSNPDTLFVSKLSRDLRFSRIPLLTGLATQDFAMVGPVEDDESTCCFNCVVERGSGKFIMPSMRETYHDATPAGNDWGLFRHTNAPIFQILGTTIAYNTFQYLTGAIDSVQKDAVSPISADLSTRKVSLLPRPNCDCFERSAKNIQRRIANSGSIRRNDEWLIDKDFGIFSHYDDINISQNYVFSSRLILLGTSQKLGHEVTGNSLNSLSEARENALLLGVSEYSLKLLGENSVDVVVCASYGTDKARFNVAHEVHARAFLRDVFLSRRKTTRYFIPSQEKIAYHYFRLLCEFGEYSITVDKFGATFVVMIFPKADLFSDKTVYYSGNDLLSTVRMAVAEALAMATTGASFYRVARILEKFKERKNIEMNDFPIDTSFEYGFGSSEANAELKAIELIDITPRDIGILGFVVFRAA